MQLPGQTYVPIQIPLVPPENLPSVIRAQVVPKPFPKQVTMSEQAFLACPWPTFRSLITNYNNITRKTISSFSKAFIASSSESNVLLFPQIHSKDSSMPEICMLHSHPGCKISHIIYLTPVFVVTGSLYGCIKS